MAVISYIGRVTEAPEDSDNRDQVELARNRDAPSTGVVESVVEVVVDGATVPRVSVLIAAFNHARHLPATLASTLAQTYSGFEVVVVDDGSLDDTPAVLAEWAERARSVPGCLRFVGVRTTNQGQSAALEVAFEHSRGDLLALLDADDLWDREKLATVCRSADGDPGAGMFVHPLRLMDEEGNGLGVLRPYRARLSSGDVARYVRRDARHVAPPTSGVVIRRSVFSKLVPMATRRFPQAADAYLTMGATLIAPVHALDEPLGSYRISTSGQFFRRLSTPEGLMRTVEIQRTIVRHFGLDDAYSESSYFQRNEFALVKLTKGLPAAVAAAGRLRRAILRDRSFSLPQRLMLAGFWTVCAWLDRGHFSTAWRWYLRRQAGLA